MGKARESRYLTRAFLCRPGPGLRSGHSRLDAMRGGGFTTGDQRARGNNDHSLPESADNAGDVIHSQMWCSQFAIAVW